MKFYAEILHPYEDKVLWHYFLEAPDEATAGDAIGKQVIAEHSNGFLLDTGGLFLQIIEEDKEGEEKLNVERIAAMSDEEVYALSSPVPNHTEDRSMRLSHRRFEDEKEMAKCFELLRTRMDKIKSSGTQGKDA
jgi:hypothetical protein